MQFVTKSSSLIDYYMNHDNKKMSNNHNTKLHWTTHSLRRAV